MKRIFASLFVVVAIVSVGVFATSAYFSASTQVTGITFTAGTTGIQLAYADMNAATPTMSSFGTTPATVNVSSMPFDVGPGLNQTYCVGIKATGDYALDLTQTMSGLVDYQDAAGQWLSQAIDLTVVAANGSCISSGTPVSNTLDQWNNYTLPLQTAAVVGTPYYFLETLTWDAAQNANDQSGLEGHSIYFNVTLGGTTAH